MPMWIHGVKFEKCLVDPGSQANIMPLREMTRTGIPFVSEVNLVKAYDNAVSKTMGKFVANLKIDSIEGRDVEFLVSENVDYPLIGLQTLGEMGIDVRCKEHELRQEASGKVVRCTATSLVELEKGKN